MVPGPAQEQQRALCGRLRGRVGLAAAGRLAGAPPLAIPVGKAQHAAACVYSRDDCSPTSVLTSLPAMPGCSQDMSCDSSCDSI